MAEALGFDWFVGQIQQVFEALPDFRFPSPALKYTIKEAALGAFSMFFSQSPSFLSYQQAMQEAQGRSNAESLFDIAQIPSDNQIRNLLDPSADQADRLRVLFDRRAVRVRVPTETVGTISVSGLSPQSTS